MQKTSGSALSRESDRVRTAGLLLSLTVPFRKQQLTLGTEIYRDKIASARFIRGTMDSNFSRDSRGRYPDNSTYLSLGMFVQDEIELHSKWSVVSGIRWSFFQTAFNLLPAEALDSTLSGIDLNFQSLTGSLGMIYKPWPQVLFRLNMAQAFRAPNLNDLSKFGESKGNIFEIPNKDLRAEKLNSIDLGGEIKFSRLVFRAAVYYAAIHDLIQCRSNLSGIGHADQGQCGI
jgi:hemoglobin/transferrin/lactoferrin receptor protein